jgi:8-oxo-dGTP diphosphatase
MPTLGVLIAIIYAGQILLTQREDFEVWCLPGGNVDTGESVAHAAVREAREETGLEVRLTRCVGIYSLPHWRAGGSHVVLFAALPVGGMMHPAANEVIDARYFDPDALPQPLFRWHRQPIHDAVSGIGGSAAWSQPDVWPFDQDDTRDTIYEQRDRSGMPRQQFYSHHFEQNEQVVDVLEVEGQTLNTTE